MRWRGNNDAWAADRDAEMLKAGHTNKDAQRVHMRSWSEGGRDFAAVFIT